MNSSISKTHLGAVSKEDGMKLSKFEHILLLLPIAGGLVFGLGPMLLESLSIVRKPFGTVNN